MKKVIKISLIIISFVWLSMELLNFGGYIYYKNFKNGKRCDLPMPSCFVQYKPWAIEIFYGIFPSVNSNYCKDCDY